MTDPVPRHVRQSITHAHQALAHIDLTIGPAYGLLALIASDGYPTTSGAGRSSSTADPTLNAVLSQGRAIDDDLRIRLRLITIGLTELAHQLDHLQRLAPADLEQRYQQARCSGGEPPWADPTCARLAVKAGLCDPCYMRGWRYRKTQRVTQPATSTDA